MPPGKASQAATERRASNNRRFGRRINDLATHPHVWVTVAAVCEHLDVDRRTLDKWIAAGLLPAYNFDGNWRVRLADVLAFVESRRYKVQ